MKIALLIHVHTNPEQVSRLVSRLRHDNVDIYINVDAKIDICEFKDKVSDVYFIENRVEVVWGRFSQVQQILNSFEEIANKQETYSHILFISGLDYPIKPISEIIQEVRNNIEKSYIDYHQLKDDDWSVLMKKRYEYWHFLPSSDLRSNGLVRKILLKLGFKRKYPFHNVYYGSCWFCLSLEAVKYLLDYTSNNSKVVDFFKYTGCSDELYIQSVLLNSSLKDKMINNIHRYFDWGDKGKSPKILTESDYSNIVQSDAWFARKLDSKVDTKLFDMLDQLNSRDIDGKR